MAVVLVVTPVSPALADVLSERGSVEALRPPVALPVPDNGELTGAQVEALGLPVEASEDATPPDGGDAAKLVVVPDAASVELPPADPTGMPVKAATESELDTDDLTAVRRGEQWTIFRRDDGSVVRRVSPEPENYLNDENRWVPISTEVTATADGFEVQDHPLEPQFAEKANADEAVAVTDAGHEVTLTPIGLAGSAGKELTGDRDGVRYANVQPNTDLEYEIEATQVKETLILRDLPEGAAEWTWELNPGTLTPVLDETGAVLLNDATGATIVAIPTPIAWDSSGVEGESSDVTINPNAALTQGADGNWRYTLTIDSQWLEASERVFPVYVDPTLATGANWLKSYKSDGVVYNGQGHTGNTRQSGTNVYWRAITGYPYDAAPGQFIGNASLRYIYAGEGNPDTLPLWVNWAACNTQYNCVGQDIGSFNLGAGDAWTAGNNNTALAQLLATQFAAGDTGVMLITRGSEGSAYTHKRINSELYVDYWGWPSVWLENGTGTPVNGTTNASTTPTLRWNGTESAPDYDIKNYLIEVSANANMSAPVWTGGWTTATNATVPEGILQQGTKYYWRVRIQDAHHGWLGQSTERLSGVWSFTTTLAPPTPPVATATPGNIDQPEVVTTLTPTLQVDAVTDPDNNPAGATITYEFKIATGMDGKSGAVYTSAPLTAGADGKVRWAVPSNVLRDGGVYAWVVQPSDGVNKNANPAWSKKIKVDLRLGATGPSPFDTAGPVTVNLANGNANLSFSSPTVSTLGGPMGMSFSYNSQQPANTNRGLVGWYYNGLDSLGNPPTAPAGYAFAGKQPLQVRTDETVGFNWGSGSPGTGVPSDYFMAKWVGFIKVPHQSTGWRFGLRHDDGVVLSVNGSKLIDKWQNVHTESWSGNTTLTGATVPIQLEYYENAGDAMVELLVDDVNDAEPAKIVPKEWLYTTPTVLPDGWAASVPIAGAASNWALATREQSAVVLTDITGRTHTYTRTSTGGYTAPAGEYGIVSLDGDGRVVLTEEDGTVYQFDRNGRLESATPVADGLKPAAPQLIYNNGVVTEIVDPVSKNGSTYDRKVTLVYQNAELNACPALPTVYEPAPVGMLCQIRYPDSGTDINKMTTLYYSGGQLWIIEDPGGERTWFGWTGTELTSLRDSTTIDYLLSLPEPTGYAPPTIDLTYENGRVKEVTLPAADGSENGARLTKEYAYTPAQGGQPGSTTVTNPAVTGATSTVSYDGTWRQLRTTSALGVWSEQTWHPTKDLPLRTTTSAGIVTTSVYDAETDRPTHSYGPAPAACFTAAGTPVANPVEAPGCGIMPSHTATTYDANLVGLQASYYGNQTLSGKPAKFALGTANPDGRVDDFWAESPGAPIPADNWSLRLTGLLTFPSTGTYTLQATSDDGVRVWLDDVNQIDRWVPQSPTATQSPAIVVNDPGDLTRRVRVEYFEQAGGATLKLEWKKSTDAAYTVIPGTALRPDYGLTSTTTTDDSTTTAGAVAPSVAAAFTYQHPWLGQATESTVDPTGLALKTRISYEQPGDSGSWLRRKSRTMPAGTTAVTTSAYYTDLETPPVGQNCVPASTKQFGALKSSTGPTPASGGAVVTEYVYDLWGRLAGTKVSGDAGWSCTGYDIRGRTTSQSIAGPTGTALQTATTRYTPIAAGLKVETFSGTEPAAGDGSTVTTVTDLLGRVVSSTDAWGTVSTTTYEPTTGRVASTATAVAGQSPSTAYFTYDLDGKLLSYKLNTVVLAAVTYNAQQLLQSVTYNGGATLASITRDQALRTIGQQWTVGTETVMDNAARSQSGRIVQHSLTRGATTHTATYGYDTAGRLVNAKIPGHDLTYAFASSGGCGVNTAAGASGNRTGMTDVYTPAGAPMPNATTTTQYCYDWADRLTSTNVSNPTAGANTVSDGVAPADIAYDARGNVTRLADMTFGYDAANRHISTTYADGSTVAIVRDVTGRISSRTVDPAGTAPAVTTKYMYAGAGDTPWAQVVGTSMTRTMVLPGGVSWTKVGTTTLTLSIPNLLGHTVLTRTGTTNSATQLWDPFGQPLDPATLAIGTTTADDSGQLNTNTGWHQSALKAAESVGPTAVVEMGARLYVPALGRFLQVDPVEGGVDNDYVWPTDPIGAADLDGQAAQVVLAGIAAVLLSPTFWLGVAAAAGAVIVVAAAVYAVQNIVRSAVRVEPVAVPRPSGSRYRESQSYSVYRISTVVGGEVWKYGITSAKPLASRPTSQLRACAAYFSQSCTYSWVAQNVKGFNNARRIEYLHIRAYRVKYGSCPPGQRLSCR
ncbi:PA14 domain-containing protein [Microbacterium sp. ZW CA_36]|uniref:PA14 domain-containing protein n=1 Tax=Microbacterium sp. ZW CA_36 TaxID=3378078 RepID=UPI003853303A